MLPKALRITSFTNVYAKVDLPEQPIFFQRNYAMFCIVFRTANDDLILLVLLFSNPSLLAF
jgi:hypothetical protein